MSQYIKYLVRYVRTRCICIRNQTGSMRSIIRLIADTSTTREYSTHTLSKNYSAIRDINISAMTVNPEDLSVDLVPPNQPELI